MRLVTRFFDIPKSSFFLLGPRGAGKSTLIRQHFKDAVWIDFLDPTVERAYTAKPERLYDILKANSSLKQVVIDEIQKVPSVLSVVHDIIETENEWQFILSGSSARKIKRAGANLLGGRALHCTIHPFMAAELQEHFNLEESLNYGLLPLVYKAKDPLFTIKSYISLYLKEEIQMEGLVRNLEHFSRFLEVISFSHASVLNITNIARECEVKRKTVANYIDILEELLLAYKLPVFTKKAQRQLSSHPKFYLFDSGVYKALRPKGPLDKPEEIEGAGLEGLVAAHLRAWCYYSIEDYFLGFWRTRSGVEVDFIVYGADGLWGIEVKNTKKVALEDVNGLIAFKSDYPIAQCLLLYRGRERIMQKGILCIPCEEFLRDLKPNINLF